MSGPLAALKKAFKDAVDRWKIDGEGGLKGFYLHSQTDRLFSWDQPKGILYEFDSNTGACTPIWSSADPATNAEIWTLLPLPPTDPAAAASGGAVLEQQQEQHSIQVAIPEGAFVGQVLQLVTPEGTEVHFQVPEGAEVGQIFNIAYTPPTDFLLLHILENKQEDPATVNRNITFFASSNKLSPSNLIDLKRLPLEGQSYVERNFSSQKLPMTQYLARMARDKPWETEYRVLRVDAIGAIIGSSLAEFEGVPGISQAHCQIKTQNEGGKLKWYVRDLGTTTGTFLNHAQVSSSELGSMIMTGMVLDLGNQAEMIVEIHEVDARGVSQTEGTFDINVFRKSSQFQNIVDDVKSRKRDRDQYQDRAEARRSRIDKSRVQGSAIERLADVALRNRERGIEQEEKILDEKQDRTVQKFQREAGMDVDGTFLGARTDTGRGGIGYVDPAAEFHTGKNMSKKDSKTFKTQKRFEKLLSKPNKK